jgi:hypothetical protein
MFTNAPSYWDKDSPGQKETIENEYPHHHKHRGHDYPDRLGWYAGEHQYCQDAPNHPEEQHRQYPAPSDIAKVPVRQA